MTEGVYSISEAAELVETQTHVLRYWEEELDIHIKRNDMGHRSYDEKDIKILQRVKTLKDRGIQLRAIKDIVHKMYEALESSEETSEPEQQMTTLIGTIDTIRVRSDDSEKEDSEKPDGDETDGRIVDFKLAQFQNLMDKVVSNSIKDNIKVITQSVSAAVSDDVVKQMDVLMKEKEEQEEARYRRLDQTIRELQHTRQEIAATELQAEKRRWFGKRQRKG